MKTETPEQYIGQLDEDRRTAVGKLRKVVLDNLPNGFTEIMGDGMISFVVPHSVYPNGYHCDPEQPLPFISIASQKNHIALYHMGLYADDEILNWFIDQYHDYSRTKLNMGKSCIRFKKPEHIPFELIGKLCSKMTSEKWIETYEDKIKH